MEIILDETTRRILKRLYDTPGYQIVGFFDELSISEQRSAQQLVDVGLCYHIGITATLKAHPQKFLDFYATQVSKTRGISNQ